MLIRERIARGVFFDPETELANKWTPRPDAYPEIFIDPAVAYGLPVTPGLVPTSALYEAWLAEDKNVDAVSDWFGISLDETQRGIDFEFALREPREALVQ